VIRASTIDFITKANVNYTLTWNYFAEDQILTTDIENKWLREAPEWLIGEAGYRISKDARDPDAIQLFDGLRTQGRAACFGTLLPTDAVGLILWDQSQWARNRDRLICHHEPPGA
jgi:hypothetical protein